MPTILSAMCIGFLSGAGVELVDQIISGEKINWEKVLVKGGTSAIGSMVGVKYIVAGALLANVLDQKVDSRGQSDRRLSISSLAKSGTKAGASKYINNKITNAEKAYKKAKVKPGKKTKGSKKKKNKSKKLSKQHKDIKKVKKVQKVRKNPVYKSITHGIKKVYNKFVKKPVAKVKKRISSIRISKKSVLGKTINKVKKVFRRWFKW